MSTILTREALLEKGKPRCENIDVQGVGTVCLRSVSELRRSQRDAAIYGASGEKVFTEEDGAKLRAYAIIDQVMSDPDNPMFTEEDMVELIAMDSAVVRPLYHAIQVFNREIEPKKNESTSSDSDST